MRFFILIWYLVRKIKVNILLGQNVWYGNKTMEKRREQFPACKRKHKNSNNLTVLFKTIREWRGRNSINQVWCTWNYVTKTAIKMHIACDAPVQYQTSWALPRNEWNLNPHFSVFLMLFIVCHVFDLLYLRFATIRTLSTIWCVFCFLLRVRDRSTL